MATASQPISCPPASGAARMVRVSSTEKMDFAPHLRDVSQFSSTPTSRLAGTPPSRGESLGDSQGVAARAFFNFGKPALPDVVEAGDPVLHEPARPVPATVSAARHRDGRKGLGKIESLALPPPPMALLTASLCAPPVPLCAHWHSRVGECVCEQIIVLEDTVELMKACDPDEVKLQERQPFNLLVIINPVIKPVGDTKGLYPPLTSPVVSHPVSNVNGYRGMVERYREVEVSGLARDGKPITVHATGWQARILQHECDHLAGLIYVDRMVPRTFRTSGNLRLPLPAGCLQPGCC
ncbi:unnamed protein product [Closterium sp. NIES-53]